MSFRDVFRSGTEPPPDPNEKLTEEEHLALQKLAAKVVEWKMASPAILFLESMKPLNWIGSQAMVFFDPFVQALFSFADYRTLQRTLEKRESMEVMIQKIEKLDAETYQKEKKLKMERRKNKRGMWDWLRGRKAKDGA